MFRKSEKIKILEIGEKRLIFGSGGATGPVGVSGGARSPEEPVPIPERGIETPDLKPELQKFEEEVKAQAADILARSKSYLQWRTHEWGKDANKDAEIVGQMNVAFSGLSSESKEIVGKFIEKLKVGDKDSQETLGRIVDLLVQRSQTLSETDDELKKITDIPIAKEAGDYLRNIVDTYNRQDGAGKVILLGAGFMLTKFLFDKEFRAKPCPLLPEGTWGDMFKYVGAGIGINYLIGAVRDDRKTGMDLLGFNKPMEDLPFQMRTLAQHAGIKNPEQFPALTRAAHFDKTQMQQWFNAYMAAKNSGSIELAPGAPPFGTFGLSPSAEAQRRKDLYGIMETMILLSNGNKVTAGMEQKFAERYFDPAKDYNFAKIVMDITLNSDIPVPLSSTDLETQRRHIDDLMRVFKSDAFRGHFDVMTDDLNSNQLIINSIPVLFVPLWDKDGKFFYKIVMPGNGDVQIYPNEIDKANIDQSISVLKNLLKSDIERRIKNHPDLNKYPVYSDGNRWIIKNIEVGGKTYEKVYISADSKDNDAFILDIGDFSVTGKTESLEDLLQNGEYAHLIENYGDGVFKGLRVHVSNVKDIGNLEGAGMVVEIEGTIAGSPFRARYNRDRKTWVENEFEFNYDDASFTNAKTELMAERAQLNSSFMNLLNIVTDANESWKPLYEWDSVDEDYWKGLVGFKQYEALNIYKSMLAGAQTSEDVEKADMMLKNLSSRVAALHEDIRSQISEDNDITEADFNGWIDKLDGLKFSDNVEWYANKDYAMFMVEIREELSDKDFGDEKDKIITLIYKQISDKTVEFSRVKGELTDDQKAYLDYVKVELNVLVQKSMTDSDVFWRGAVTLVDMVPGASWALNHSRGFVDTWGDLYEKIDDNVKNEDVRRFFNLMDYRSWYAGKHNGALPPNPARFRPGDRTTEDNGGSRRGAGVPGDGVGGDTGVERDGGKPREKMEKWFVLNHINYRYTNFARAVKKQPKNERKQLFYKEVIGVYKRRIADSDRIVALPDRKAQDDALRNYSRNLLEIAKKHMSEAAWKAIESEIAPDL